MPLKGPAAVTPNITSSNTRRINVLGAVIAAGNGITLGPLQVAAQGRVGFALNVVQPHPPLQVTVTAASGGVTVTLDEFIIPASVGIGSTRVLQTYEMASAVVTVTAQDYTVAGGFSTEPSAIYSMTA